MRNNRFNAVSSFVLVYMLLAFIWWSFLLIHKNNDAYKAKIELQQLGMTVEGIIPNDEAFFQTDRYKQLKKEYDAQKVMIIGEAVALSLSVLISMFVVYRSYRREILVSQQQSNFLLSITHELKSPIASMRLSLETIARQYQKLKPEQINRLSVNAIKDADRLTKLVGDILLSASLESTHQFHKEEVDIITLLEKIQQYYTDAYQGISIKLNQKESIPILLGDQQALSSMLTNLIENAIKYSPKPANIELNITPKNNSFVEIQVADQGVGIPKKERNLVFNKFYRVGNENTRTTNGTGLGLYIVNEIVKGHGGKVIIADNEPMGTVFSVLLPITS